MGMHKVVMVIGALAAAATASTPVRAQDQAPGPLPKFEVASLKESTQRTQARTQPGGGLIATQPLKLFIADAYLGATPLATERVGGGPDWIELGLKIQSGKAPLPVVIIDSIERPTPD